MSFEIHPAMLADVPELVRVYHESFADDVDFLTEFKEVPSHVLTAYHHSQISGDFEHSWSRVFKVVDGADGSIAGFSVWQFPRDGELVRPDEAFLEEYEDNPDRVCLGGNEDSPGREISKEEKPNKGLLPWWEVEGINLDWAAMVNRLRTEADDRWLNRHTDFLLGFLAVRPYCRRLGVGSLLVRAGIDFADKIGAMSFVKASPMGLLLYEKLGFKRVGEFISDSREYGVYKEVCLIREPRHND